MEILRIHIEGLADRSQEKIFRPSRARRNNGGEKEANKSSLSPQLVRATNLHYDIPAVLADVFSHEGVVCQ